MAGDLSEEQVYCGELVYRWFHANGAWPIVEDLEYSEFKRRSGVEVRAILQSYPYRYGGFDNDDRFWLSIRGIYLCVGAVDELRDFVIGLRLCLERFEESRTALVTGSELLLMGFDSGQVQRFFRLIQHEQRIWQQLSGSNPNDWQLGLSSELRRLADVSDLDGYVRRTNELDGPLPPPGEVPGSYRPPEAADARTMQVEPVFHARGVTTELDLVFVLMPFSQSWSNGVWRAIQLAVSALGMRALRADQMHGPVITEDVWTGILRARVVVADVSDRNPNVYYELGVSHTVGRDFVLISQDAADAIPFDTHHFRHIQYTIDRPGLEQLVSRLGPAILYFTTRE
jgi:hypothetical protein